MLNPWESLYAALIGTVTTWQSSEHFRALQSTDAVLATYESASMMLEYFTSQEVDLDQKDRIYAALICAVQGNMPWAPLARALLWCGLWPGLDRLYRRRVIRFRDDPDEVTQAISVAFMSLIANLDLERVHRVAATLVRNTEGAVRDELRRSARHQAAPLEDDVGVDARPRARLRGEDAGTELPGGGAGLGDLNRLVRLPQGAPLSSQLNALRQKLASLVEWDPELVFLVAVLELDQREAAKYLGLSHTAARKRFQRAAAHLRDLLSRSQ